MRFYLHLYKAAVLARLEYRSDLAISIGTSLLTQASALSVFHIVFSHTGDLSGWVAPQVLLLFGMVTLTFATSELFFNGIWSLPGYIVSGRLDRLLVSPARSLGYLLLSQPQLHALGNLGAGIAMVAASFWMLDPPPALYWLLPVLVASGAVTYTAVLVALGTLSFVLIGPYGDHLRLAIQLLNATRYPLAAYPSWMRVILLFVVPVGVSTHVPGAWLRGELSLWVAAIVPPVLAAASGVCATAMWRLGVRCYQSTGS